MQIDFKLFLQEKHVLFKASMCDWVNFMKKKSYQMVARENTH
jgi:hypothetical protein